MEISMSSGLLCSEAQSKYASQDIHKTHHETEVGGSENNQISCLQDHIT